MKSVQHAVEHGHQQHAPAKQEQNAAVQGVKARKQLARIGGHDTRRPHAAQNHGGVEKGIDPRHHTLKTQEENKGIYLYYSPNGIIQYNDTDYAKQIADKTEFA